MRIVPNGDESESKFQELAISITDQVGNSLPEISIGRQFPRIDLHATLSAAPINYGNGFKYQEPITRIYGWLQYGGSVNPVSHGFKAHRDAIESNQYNQPSTNEWNSSFKYSLRAVIKCGSDQTDMKVPQLESGRDLESNWRYNDAFLFSGWLVWFWKWRWNGGRSGFLVFDGGMCATFPGSRRGKFPERPSPHATLALFQDFQDRESLHDIVAWATRVIVFIYYFVNSQPVLRLARNPVSLSSPADKRVSLASRISQLIIRKLCGRRFGFVTGVR